MVTKKLKIGIAGYGVVGRRRRLCIDNNHYMETIAVCDIRLNENAAMIDGERFNYDYSSLENKHSSIFQSGVMKDGINHYSKYVDMLENESLDVIFVCLLPSIFIV